MGNVARNAVFRVRYDVVGCAAWQRPKHPHSLRPSTKWFSIVRVLLPIRPRRRDFHSIVRKSRRKTAFSGRETHEECFLRPLLVLCTQKSNYPGESV
ncbi:unnamed protein product [Hermetia illucens]|uniref:Uncharacterized protein n=1 Tax=Hermetia illucens TaxID=343691 RepID=A0A7R8UVF7_HERIL|nr:unnamed protein product [Hermetia illucens]